MMIRQLGAVLAPRLFMKAEEKKMKIFMFTPAHIVAGAGCTEKRRAGYRSIFRITDIIRKVKGVFGGIWAGLCADNNGFMFRIIFYVGGAMGASNEYDQEKRGNGHQGQWHTYNFVGNAFRVLKGNNGQ